MWEIISVYIFCGQWIFFKKITCVRLKTQAPLDCTSILGIITGLLQECPYNFFFFNYWLLQVGFVEKLWALYLYILKIFVHRKWLLKLLSSSSDCSGWSFTQVFCYLEKMKGYTKSDIFLILFVYRFWTHNYWSYDKHFSTLIYLISHEQT